MSEMSELAKRLRLMAGWHEMAGFNERVADLLAAAEACEAAQPTAVQRPPLGKPLDAALRCCDQLTAQLATAEEVIAACEKHIADTLEGMPDKIDPRMKYREFQYHDYELDEMRALLNMCARWKEANGGTA